MMRFLYGGIQSSQIVAVLTKYHECPLRCDIEQKERKGIISEGHRDDIQNQEMIHSKVYPVVFVNLPGEPVTDNVFDVSLRGYANFFLHLWCVIKEHIVKCFYFERKKERYRASQTNFNISYHLLYFNH